jgi:hypothetical protein
MILQFFYYQSPKRVLQERLQLWFFPVVAEDCDDFHLALHAELPTHRESSSPGQVGASWQTKARLSRRMAGLPVDAAMEGPEDDLRRNRTGWTGIETVDSAVAASR